MMHGVEQYKNRHGTVARLLPRPVGVGLILVLALPGAFSSPRAWAADPSPTPNPAVTPLPGWDPTTVQKVVLVRTLGGAPVPDLTVDLAPAPATLGGPPPGTAGQHGRTDAQGMARFTGLGRWIWMVSFAGRYQERALQPLAGQGQPPYGRTRAGGGFPLAVEPQEEGDAPTPVVSAGQVQPEVQTATFVLVPTAAEWAPALDLALPPENPVPLSDWALAPVSPVAGVLTLRFPQPAAEDDLPRWLYLLAVFGFMLVGIAWWQRRARLYQPVPDERDAP
jgi:hypothetical protein